MKWSRIYGDVAGGASSDVFRMAGWMKEESGKTAELLRVGEWIKSVSADYDAEKLIPK